LIVIGFVAVVAFSLVVAIQKDQDNSNKDSEAYGLIHPHLLPKNFSQMFMIKP